MTVQLVMNTPQQNLVDLSGDVDRSTLPAEVRRVLTALRSLSDTPASVPAPVNNKRISDFFSPVRRAFPKAQTAKARVPRVQSGPSSGVGAHRGDSDYMDAPSRSSSPVYVPTSPDWSRLYREPTSKARIPPLASHGDTQWDTDGRMEAAAAPAPDAPFPLRASSAKRKRKKKNKRKSRKRPRQERGVDGSNYWENTTDMNERIELLKKATQEFVPAKTPSYHSEFKRAANCYNLRTAVRMIKQNVRPRQTKIRREVDYGHPEVYAMVRGIFLMSTEEQKVKSFWSNAEKSMDFPGGVECNACMSMFDKKSTPLVHCTSGHGFCGSCVLDVVKSRLNYRQVGQNVRECMEGGCSAHFEDYELRKNLSNEVCLRLVEEDRRYIEDEMLRSGDKRVHCKRCDMCIVVDPNDLVLNQILCPKCCMFVSVGEAVNKAVKAVNKAVKGESAVESLTVEYLRDVVGMKAIRCECGQLMERNEGCKHMTCKTSLGCGRNLCWDCGHFNSVSSFKCYGKNKWHEKEFQTPCCNKKMYIREDPNGPVPCNPRVYEGTGCNAILEFAPNGKVNIVSGSAAL